MRKLKTVFDAKGNENIGSYRIPFIGIRSVMEKMNDVIVMDDADKSIPDVIICLGGQGRAKINKEKYPDSFIVLFKPHRENVLSLSFLMEPIVSVKNLISFCKTKFGKDYNQQDIKYSDLLIADSRRLLLFYHSQGKRVFYFKLMEIYNYFPEKPIELPRVGEELNITFHGSATHYNESAKCIEKLVCNLSCRFKVNFYCFMNLKEKFYDIKHNNINIHYIDYDNDKLNDVLKKTHLGLVTNIIKHRSFFEGVLGSWVLFGKYQSSIDIISQKFSSNSGRSYLFAHYGIPFVSHPIAESLMDYAHIEGMEFPVSCEEMIYFSNNLLSDPDKYFNMSSDLLKFSKNNNLKVNTYAFVQELKSHVKNYQAAS